MTEIAKGHRLFEFGVPPARRSRMGWSATHIAAASVRTSIAAPSPYYGPKFEPPSKLRSSTLLSSDRPQPRTYGRAQRRRELKREEILDAAEDLIAIGGFDALTIPQIANAADVSLGGFYSYFASKEELTAAVVARVSQRLVRRVDLVGRQIDDPALFAAFAVRTGLKRARDNPVWSWVLGGLDASSAEFQPEIKQTVADQVSRGIASGRFRVADLPTVLLALNAVVVAMMKWSVHAQNAEVVAHETVAIALRTLGVEFEEAERIASADVSHFIALADVQEE